jgi:hypothetical protein
LPAPGSSLVDVIVWLLTRSDDDVWGVLETLRVGEVSVVLAAAATLRARGTAGRARAATRDRAHAACITQWR